MGKSKKNITDKDDEVDLRRPCKYIGSFAINMMKSEERQTLMNERLEELKHVKKGIHVVLQISTEGIKVYDEKQQVVKMAHAIMRVAFSTCSPDTRLFAYVARSTTSLKSPSILQAHVFKTKKGSHAQQMAAMVSKAFRITFAMATLQRTSKLEKFENDVDKSSSGNSPLQQKRRWAKKEIARGHDYSEHAERAKKFHPLAMLPGSSDPIDSQMLPSRKISTTDFDNQRLANRSKHLDHTLDDYEEIPAHSETRSQGCPPELLIENQSDSEPITSAQIHQSIANGNGSAMAPANSTPKTERMMVAEDEEPSSQKEQGSLTVENMSRSESSLAVASIDEVINAYSDGDGPNEDHYSEIMNVEQKTEPLDAEQNIDPANDDDRGEEGVIKYERMTGSEKACPEELYVKRDTAGDENQDISNHEALYINVDTSKIESSDVTSVQEELKAITLDQSEVNNELPVNDESIADDKETSTTEQNEPSIQSNEDRPGTPYMLEPNTNMDSFPREKSGTFTDEDLMRESYWYQAGLSREISEELLKNEEVGSFFIRNSTSVPGSYAMSIKIPKSIKDSEIGNILIDKTVDGNYKIPGFRRSFPSIPMLVAYYASFKDELPVRLRLDNDNPLFDMEDGDAIDGVETVVDPDYQRFDSSEPIMNELASE